MILLTGHFSKFVSGLPGAFGSTLFIEPNLNSSRILIRGDFLFATIAPIESVVNDDLALYR